MKTKKRWFGNIEIESRKDLTYWWPTGKHICTYIIGEEMGKKNKGRCMICGKHKP